MLPKERQCLQDDLNAFEYQVKQYVSPVSGGEPKPGYRPPVTGGDSRSQSAQAIGGSGPPSYSAAVCSQATSSPSSGLGNTFTKIMFLSVGVLSLQESRRHLKCFFKKVHQKILASLSMKRCTDVTHFLGYAMVIGL